MSLPFHLPGLAFSSTEFLSFLQSISVLASTAHSLTAAQRYRQALSLSPLGVPQSGLQDESRQSPRPLQSSVGEAVESVLVMALADTGHNNTEYKLMKYT